MTDSHCHLQAESFIDSIDEALVCAKRAGVERFVVCSTSTQDFDDVEKLAAKYSQILPAYGIHPWYIDRASSDWENILKGMLQNNPYAIVGEIGLDFEKCKHDINIQEEIFVKQLRIAEEYSRPVSVHCRKAWHRLMPLLNEAKFKQNIMIHSYSGSISITEQLAKYTNIYFSFSGSITNPANKTIADVISKVPMDRILIETDSPDIMPFVGGKKMNYPNTPANLIHVANTLAQILSMKKEELSLVLQNNFERFIGK